MRLFPRFVFPLIWGRNVLPVLEHSPLSCQKPHRRDVMVSDKQDKRFWFKDGICWASLDVHEVAPVDSVKRSESLQAPKMPCVYQKLNGFEETFSNSHPLRGNSHRHNQAGLLSRIAIRRSRFWAFSLFASAFIKFALAVSVPSRIISSNILLMAIILASGLDPVKSMPSLIMSPVPVFSQSMFNSGNALEIRSKEPSVMRSPIFPQNPPDKPHRLSNTDGLIFLSSKNE